MENNQFFINIKDNKVKLSFKNTPSLPDFLQVMQTAILTAFQTVRDSADDKEKATKELYDLYNIAASNTLHFFAPDLEQHPNLTAEAILKAENEILEKAWRAKRESKSKTNQKNIQKLPQV